MSDEMEVRTAQFSSFIGFGREFLHPVFAEDAEPRFVCFADGGRGKSLAHRHERDPIGIAPGASGCLVDALTDARDVFGDQERVIRSSRRAGRGMRALLPRWCRA